MNTDQIRSTLPSGEAFRKFSPDQKKQCVFDYIDAILSAIEGESRAPDEWESHDLGAAIGLCMAGWYYAALTGADRSLTPSDQRAPVWLKTDEPLPTEMQLRRALDYARGIPV